MQAQTTDTGASIDLPDLIKPECLSGQILVEQTLNRQEKDFLDLLACAAIESAKRKIGVLEEISKKESR